MLLIRENFWRSWHHSFDRRVARRVKLVFACVAYHDFFFSWSYEEVLSVNEKLFTIIWLVLYCSTILLFLSLWSILFQLYLWRLSCTKRFNDYWKCEKYFQSSLVLSFVCGSFTNSFFLNVIANKHNRANTLLPIVHAGSWLNLPWKLRTQKVFSIPLSMLVCHN